MTVEKSITTGENGAMNQSEFLAITLNSLEAWEKSRVQDAIGFASHWFKKTGARFLSQSLSVAIAITFDSHLKTAPCVDVDITGVSSSALKGTLAKTALSVANATTVIPVTWRMDPVPANPDTMVNTVNTNAQQIVTASIVLVCVSVLRPIRSRVTGRMEPVSAQMDPLESFARVFVPRDFSGVTALEIAIARTMLCVIT